MIYQGVRESKNSGFVAAFEVKLDLLHEFPAVRHFRTEVGILDLLVGGLKPVGTFALHRHGTMGDVHCFFLFGNRDGRIAEFLKVLAGVFDGFAIGDGLGVLGHGALLVVFDHSGGGLFGGGEIVFVECGGESGVALKHVIGVGFMLCSLVIVFVLRQGGRSCEGEGEKAEGQCRFDFHFLYF